MTRARVAARVTAVTLLSGVLAGLVGAFMTLLLSLVQWLSLGVAPERLLTDPRGVPAWRLVLAPLVGCTIAGVSWWWIRGHHRIVPVRRALQEGGEPMGWWPMFADACLQIVMVGSGGSLGREGAPRQAAAAATDTLARRVGGIPEFWRSAMVASAAGAGLAAVYNVPLSGVIFALEVARRRWSLRVGVLAAVMSGLATVVAWPIVSMAPTYRFPAVSLPPATGFGLLATAPLWALVGLGFASLVSPARRHAPFHGREVAWLVPVAGVVLGVVTIWGPVATGNGKEMVQLVFLAPAIGAAGYYGMLAVVKPLLTAGFIRAGAEGGLITPSMATGAVAAGAVLLATGHPGLVAVAAIAAASGVLAVVQNAPVFGGVMGWELTHASPSVGLLVLATSVISWALATAIRHVSRRLLALQLLSPAGGVQAVNTDDAAGARRG